MPLKDQEGLVEIPGEEHTSFIQSQIHRSLQTNWWVITGPPNAGKTTLVNYLAFLGHRVIPEAARVLIDDELSKGNSIAKIRADELAFQRKVAEMKRQAEERIPLSELTFLDRGRKGDDAAYLVSTFEEQGTSLPMVFLHGILTGRDHRYRYKGVFLLERLPSYEQDYARIEDETKANRISDLLRYYYADFLGYQVREIPVASVGERARIILETIQSFSPSQPSTVHEQPVKFIDKNPLLKD
jgi:predicted ATPase